jgi:hypothetical protein
VTGNEIINVPEEAQVASDDTFNAEETAVSHCTYLFSRDAGCLRAKCRQPSSTLSNTCRNTCRNADAPNRRDRRRLHRLVGQG